MAGEVVLSVLVTRLNVVGVTVDLNVSTNGHVRRSDELVVLVHVLVSSALEELALNDARVLLGRLVNRDRVVSQVERDDEPSVNILGHSGVETGSEAQDLLVIVHRLEEVTLRLLRDQLVDVTKGVLLVTESVVGRNHDRLGLTGLGVFNLTEFEVSSVLSSIESLGVLVDTVDAEDAAKGVNGTTGHDLVAGQVVVANEVLTGLVYGVVVRQLLSSQKEREGVTAVVGVMDLSDLDSVVSKVVVDDEGQVFTSGVETENLTIVVQELLLGGNLATAEGLLEELHHLAITVGGNGSLGLHEGIIGQRLGRSLRGAEVLQQKG